MIKIKMNKQTSKEITELINCDPYCEYGFHRFRTHRKLPSKTKLHFLNTGYDAYISN